MRFGAFPLGEGDKEGLVLCMSNVYGVRGRGVGTWEGLYFPDNEWAKFSLWLLGIITRTQHGARSASTYQLGP